MHSLEPLAAHRLEIYVSKYDVQFISNSPSPVTSQTSLANQLHFKTFASNKMYLN